MDHGKFNVLMGRRLRSRRRALGLTQGDVARRCGVSPQQIQKYESGAQVSAVRLWALAEVLQVPVGSFFESIMSASAGGANSHDRPDAGPQIQIGG